ncbi:hypothetical protein Glove_856g13 [Diversispora epigaea]|uniref:Uncharacterized protein n=1 Tax=Diversispora epigaea TaxID=1348612 RepID=A0A397G1P5_9GLOM|nr:hypothetical protein Glove_856g13 [Diversispora epigaea]
MPNSKVYTFNIPIQPRNATDAFDSKQLELEISEDDQEYGVQIKALSFKP